jgi:hypothetical protein
MRLPEAASAENDVMLDTVTIAATVHRLSTLIISPRLQGNTVYIAVHTDAALIDLRGRLQGPYSATKPPLQERW